jgi:hypothetical protein
MNSFIISYFSDISLLNKSTEVRSDFRSPTVRSRSISSPRISSKNFYLNRINNILNKSMDGLIITNLSNVSSLEEGV